ncbi:hypothetical protein VNI00_006398 [Paramarasmius palmivorus]|uniref:Pectate lyase domain-containing protein n=1 Tax=Paramarasmius palmivorus TaxID=297713 RepID=A0AAW0D7P8_9AGAR
MKWLISVVTFIALQCVMASPLEKRASVNDVATIGYATLNGGTSGGSGGTSTTVTSLSALTNAVAGDAKKVVIISGTISGDAAVKVGPNTTVVGQKGSSLVGVGLRVIDASNVIIRNVKISKVLADTGDAIGIQSASQVWIDHVDLSSDLDHDKCRHLPKELSYSLRSSYDGLLDITHGATGVTVSNSKFYNHYKASLVGHSDSNYEEDVAITVTYVGNYWSNIGSRTPSFRFGHGHIFNSFFESNSDGINARAESQLLVENNVWTGSKKALYSTTGGAAVANGNEFGGAENSAQTGTFTTAPYSYTLLPTSNVKDFVKSNAGQTLDF